MKFGLIVPSSNTTMESEFWRMVMGWATVHTARVGLRKIKLGELEEMEQDVFKAATHLADAGVDVIGYGCTSGSLYKGRNHALELERRIAEKSGIPVVVTAMAVVEALKELRINKICVATPYTQEINRLEEAFLEQNGISVLKIKGLNLEENKQVGFQNPRIAQGLAKEVYVPETQGIFISCTNFRTIEVIDNLERELSIPVISSNTATLWAMMRKTGSKKKLNGYGRLLARSSKI